MANPPLGTNPNATPTSDRAGYIRAARQLGIQWKGVPGDELRRNVTAALAGSSVNQFIAANRRNNNPPFVPPSPPTVQVTTASTQSNPFINRPAVSQSAQGAPSPDLTHPFKVSPAPSSGVIVYVNSFLWRNPGKQAADLIVLNVNTPISAGAGNSLYIVNTFSSFPSVYTTQIVAASPSATAYEFDVNGVQSIGRYKIADLISNGSSFDIVQICNTNLAMKLYFDAGFIVNHPVPV